jgi:hypothetical protein
MMRKGVLAALNDKLRFGVIVAERAITKGSGEAAIEYAPFDDVDELELLALQSVYSYLWNCRLVKTVSCLEDESRVEFQERSCPDLVEVIMSRAVEQTSDHEQILARPGHEIVDIAGDEFDALPFIVAVDDL